MLANEMLQINLVQNILGDLLTRDLQTLVLGFQKRLKP